MPLTDVTIKNIKPTGKILKLFDGGGLYLLVTATGHKWWRLKYRIAGKEKLFSLGVYPEVSLKEAREKRDEARKYSCLPSFLKESVVAPTRPPLGGERSFSGVG